MEEFPITPEDSAELFKLIEADRTTGLIPVPAPIFFFHVGQPGCGKTELNNLARMELADNLLECNADTLRNYHPDVEQILRERELDYPDLTWPAAKRWNDSLIDTGVDRHYNLLIETTLKDATQALATLARMKEHAYTTVLQILAVPYRWSWLGIYTRYESLKARIGFARIVTETDHDDRFNRLQESLGMVITSPHLDHVTVYQRQLTIGAETSAAVKQVAQGKEAVLETFFDIIRKPMDEEERVLFQRECANVAELMRDRGARSEYIAAFEKKANELAQ